VSVGRVPACMALAFVVVACAPWRAPGGAADATPPDLRLTEADRYVHALSDASFDDADRRWWRRFDDADLGVWVERALAANPDIAQAQERVQQARALLAGARARRGVFVGAQADATVQLRREAGERRVQPGAAVTLEYDADLWGQLRAAERSAAAGVRRSEHLAQAARLEAAGLAARAYVEWRAARRDLQALDDAVVLQREALRIVSVRVDAGLAPVLDRDRAQAELADTDAERAEAEARVAQSLAALQVLGGERPTASPDAARGDAPRELPSLQGPLPAGRPVDLLRVRPDLRAAEAALVAAAEDVGVAEAELLPRLRLPGSLVFGSAMAGGAALELASATLAAVLDATLFDGGARRADVDAAQSRAREAALLYRRTLLDALQQVESALAARRGAEARIAARQRAADAARAAESQAQTLYRSGLTGYLDVVDAQRSALTQQRALLQAQADAAAAAVTAFEAMGLIDAPAGS
jgi:multidrug efflux system outer membrane protein